jgi:hypothetical protein
MTMGVGGRLLIPAGENGMEKAARRARSLILSRVCVTKNITHAIISSEERDFACNMRVAEVNNSTKLRKEMC